MDESLKADVMYWAAFYERRMRVGNKKIFHLEAWVVKVMSLYKVMYTPVYWFKGGGEAWTPRATFSACDPLLIICILFLGSTTSLMWTWTI